MKIVIDDRLLPEYDLTLSEVLFLLFIESGGNTKECITSLVNKGWGGRDLFDDDSIVLSDNNKEKLYEIIVDSEKIIQDKKDELEQLAIKLMELYPEGRKPGTTYKWRGSVAEITRKLKNLVAKYNCKFTEEQAIKATKDYISSFNGDYRFMKLLKYFLLKAPRNNNGDVEIESDFMAYLEDTKDEVRNDNWTTDLK